MIRKFVPLNSIYGMQEMFSFQLSLWLKLRHIIFIILSVHNVRYSIQLVSRLKYFYFFQLTAERDNYRQIS